MPAHLTGCVGISEQCRPAADQGERGVWACAASRRTRRTSALGQGRERLEGDEAMNDLVGRRFLFKEDAETLLTDASQSGFGK
jgi:hypothetical protein